MSQKKHLSKLVVVGEKNPKSGGHFVSDYDDKGKTKKIPTFRCYGCLQHMSLFEYSISKLGVVSPNIICKNCGYDHGEVTLEGLGGKKKYAGVVFLG